MTNWIVQRVDTNPAGADAELTCVEPSVPYKVTCLDTDTGSVRVVTMCADPTIDPLCIGDGWLDLLDTTLGGDTEWHEDRHSCS